MQISHFLQNDAELDQNITWCSRVGAFTLTVHGRTLLQFDTSWVLTVLENVAKKA